VKAIIFDLDGTLVDSRDSILSSIEYGLGTIGLQGISFDRIKAVQNDLRTTIETTAKNLNFKISEEDVLKFITAYREHHSQDPELNMKVYDGVPEMLSNLRSRFSIAVATTKHTKQAEHVLDRLKISEFFQHIQGTDPGLRYKPAPDILHATLKILDLSEMPAAYIGDSAHDMTAAKAAEMHAIGAAYGFGGRSHLEEAQPHHIVDSIRELESYLL
jgi:phosphoglycolate phosphatase